ncbi:MAG: hypothetical protein AAFO68_05415 [Pseudomonadota bacterium]
MLCPAIQIPNAHSRFETYVQQDVLAWPDFNGSPGPRVRKFRVSAAPAQCYGSDPFHQ